MPDNIYPAEGEIAIVRFQKTVRSLHDDSANGEVDVRGLELIRTLAQPVAKRNADLWFNELQLTTQFLANIDKRLDKPIRAYGNLKGVLEQINVHGRNEFVIYPPIRTKGIRCAFLEQLTEKVGASIRKSVTVRGMMLYLPDAAFPHFVEVDELTTHPQDSELPSLRDLRGIAPNCTGGMSTLDFLRSLHNE